MLAKSVLGQVEQSTIGSGRGQERRFSSMTMGKEEVVVTDAVEAVLSLNLVRVGSIVRTRMCALSK